MIEQVVFNPKPGDFVRKGNMTRTVLSVDGGNVEYETEKGKIKTCWITTWRDWCNKDLDEAIPSDWPPEI